MLSFAVAYGQAEYRVDDTSDGTIISVVDGDRIYDSGGDDENYDSNEDYTVTFCVSTDSFIIIDIDAFDLEWYTDFNLYAGLDNSGTEIADYSNYSSVAASLNVLSSCATITFKSGSYTDPGFELSIRTISKSDYLVLDGGTHNDICAATFYDSGGDGNDYSSNEENNATTFCA